MTQKKFDAMPLQNIKIIYEATGQKITVEEISPDVTSEELLNALLTKLGLPIGTHGILFRQSINKPLLPRQTLGKSGVGSDETLTASFHADSLSNIKQDFYIIYNNQKLPIQEVNANNISVKDIISIAVKNLDLPTRDYLGNTIGYVLAHPRVGQVLRNGILLTEVDIREHDELELLPELIKTQATIDKTPDDSLVNINLSAPLRIPNREQLAVPLIPSHFVYRLEEYRSDQNRSETIMWVFIGAILGVITNLATQSPIIISVTSLLAIIIFSVIALLLWRQVKDLKDRAEKLRDELLKIDAPSNISFSNSSRTQHTGGDK